MHSAKLLHRVLAFVCLFTLGFQTVAGALLVQCTDSRGQTQIELGGCSRDESGRCLQSCQAQSANSPGTDESSNQSPDRDPDQDPCQDDPVKTDLTASAPRASAPSPHFDLSLATFTLLSLPIEPPPSAALLRRVDLRAAAPPPALACIRSIVLVI